MGRIYYEADDSVWAEYIMRQMIVCGQKIVWGVDDSMSVDDSMGGRW